MHVVRTVSASREGEGEGLDLMKVRENGATQGSSNDLVRERKEEAE